MKKTIFIISTLFITGTGLIGQNTNGSGNQGFTRCATKVPSAAWDEQFNKQVEAFKQQHAADIANGKTTATTYTVPMIFHIIHGGQAVGTYPNLNALQVQSQVTVLNQDYGGTGAGVSTYTALTSGGNGPFYDYATTNTLPAPNNTSAGILPANLNITFVLAPLDTAGNPLPEPGIDRVNYNDLAPSSTYTNTNPAQTSLTINNFSDFIDNIIKAPTIWDVTKYFNVWLTDEYQGTPQNPSGPGLLGYSTFPVNSTLTGLSGPYGDSYTDGCWFYAKACGSKNIYTGGSYTPDYNLGRTITHECGHYLGLRHTWGDGSCVTDYCNDTPPEGGATYYGVSTGNSSWVYPYTKTNNCTATGAYKSDDGDGIMYMNFMDYSDDAYMCLFTPDQVTRMQTALTNSPNRNQLTQSATNMGVGIKNTNPLAGNISLYPNPNNGQFNFSVALAEATNLNFSVVNMLGQVVFNKTENNISQTVLSYNLNALGKGVYFINITDSKNNKTVKKMIIE
jgi:hypothetical protein